MQDMPTGPVGPVGALMLPGRGATAAVQGAAPAMHERCMLAATMGCYGSCLSILAIVQDNPLDDKLLGLYM
jgi:hypothetical protein